MKFFSEPSMFIRINNKNLQRIVGKKGFYFDENGEYETDNKYLIEALKVQFRYEDIAEKAEEVAEEAKAFACKVCGEGFENKGKFLAHSRTHKRGE